MNDNNTTPAMKEGDTVDFEYHTEQDVITGTGKIIWINNNDCVVETQKGKSKPKRHMMEISALKNPPLPEAQPLEGVKTVEEIFNGHKIIGDREAKAYDIGKQIGYNQYHAQFATNAGGGKAEVIAKAKREYETGKIGFVQALEQVYQAKAPSTHSSSEMVEKYRQALSQIRRVEMLTPETEAMINKLLNL